MHAGYLSLVCQFSETNSAKSEIPHKSMRASALPTPSHYARGKFWFAI